MTGRKRLSGACGLGIALVTGGFALVLGSIQAPIALAVAGRAVTPAAVLSGLSVGVLAGLLAIGVGAYGLRRSVGNYELDVKLVRPFYE